MNTKTDQKGFTIIEVVLVLAIAALIFLMIFIALPALQRGQRDTARKQDQNKVVTAVNTWRSNHRGQLPDKSDQAEFQEKYVKELSQYNFDQVSLDDSASPLTEDSLTLDNIVVVLGHSCSDDGSDIGDSSSRAAAVFIRLEASEDVVCSDA